jgi:hypothetical protein
MTIVSLLGYFGIASLVYRNGSSFTSVVWGISWRLAEFGGIE